MTKEKIKKYNPNKQNGGFTEDQLKERENTIKQLREELGRSGKTTWVEDNG